MTTATTTAQLDWGLQPPPGTTVAWGARAISDHGALDLLYDRQSAVGTKPERKRLQAAMNALLPLAREAWRAKYRAGEVRPDEALRVTIAEGDGWVVEADTRGSCGYVYLVAYATPSAAEPRA
jgi:cytoskeleton bundling-enhancing protein CbeA-like protein